MRINIPIVFLSVVLFSSGCLKRSAVSGTDEQTKLIMEMEKTSCYGDCPVYTLQLFSDGEITIDARANMEWIGKFKTYLNGWQYRKLQKQFDRADFFELENEYESLATDLPTTFLYYTDGENEKKIKIYDKEPKELTELVDALEEMINDLEWKRQVTDLDL